MFPRGATPVDFAYGVHSEVGEHCSGARANGQIVPLRYAMRNGDVIEIMTSPQQRPNKDWLDFVTTTRARTRIRAYLRSERRQKSLNLGHELLETEMHGAGMSLAKFLKQEDEVKRVVEAHRMGSKDELLLAVGYGKLAADELVKTIRARHAESAPGTPAPIPPQLKAGAIETLVRRVTGKDHGGIRVSGIDDVLVRYARCCNPLPGDAIIGFITRGRGVTVHRRECQKAFDTDPERRIEVSWDSNARIHRPVQLRVTTANKPGILATVSQTFSAQKINISEANCRAGDDGRAINVFTFMCNDVAQLKTVMKNLQKLNGVVAVDRV
jgi:GTP pyrophosphokinase